MGDNNTKKLRERNEIDKKYKWNIEAMYPDEAKWDTDISECTEAAAKFAEFAGHLGDSAATLLDALRTKDEIWQKLERAFVYARMRKDEDNRVSKYQAMCDKSQVAIAKVASSMSFFTPELLDIPEERLLGFIDEEEGLKVYEFLIKDTLRMKAHVLSKAEENIMAQMSEITGAADDIFTMLNNADMKFGEIMDEDGEMVELTQGNYISFMESYNRDVRKAAFEAKYKSYIDLINTIATAYSYNTKTDVVTSRIRKYPSSLEAALAGDNIPKSVYTNLIKAVHDGLPAMYKYMELRKKLLGVDELHMYDVYVPLIEIEDKPVSYEEALEIMRNGLAVLGEEYINRAMNGVKEGWIDVYENKGKTSGAYSFGSYDSFPYVLLNFSGKLKDVFTIVHEMGHSMHSSYTRETQPFVYGSHSIFTAEVASTVNEALLMKHLIKEQDEIMKSSEKGSKEYEDALTMKKYLLNMHIEEFRTTLFRQTMFAEFEMLTHEAVENGEVLTAEWCCEKYAELNRLYFGENVVTDNEIAYEWARIPHFYRAFYVYKYATGYSAASAISDLIIKGVQEGTDENIARDNYKKFLTTGESDYPIELLKIAGVDMGTEVPVLSAMKTFAELVDEFAALCE
ncbi:MAG: oligoendopeptidase F [Clostridiales bacterium]|nr:oligoendopeptidase F [Clostridiales bacterium]